MSRNKLRSIELRGKLLRIIGKFGWIRTIEIARIIWKPDNFNDDKNAYKYAHKMLNDLKAENIVHLAKMPGQVGTAVFLQNKGISIVRRMNIKATKVRSNNETWKAPPTWMHDLLTQGLFAFLVRYHFINEEVYLTDRECRSALIDTTSDVFGFNPYQKIPDVVVKMDSRYIAIEVERASKNKGDLKPLVDTLVRTNLGNVPNKYNGIKPDLVAIAFDPAQKTTSKVQSTKKTSLNHASSVLKQVIEKMNTDGIEEVPIMLISLDVYNFGVCNLHSIYESPLYKNKLNEFLIKYEKHLKEYDDIDYRL